MAESETLQMVLRQSEDEASVAAQLITDRASAARLADLWAGHFEGTDAAVSLVDNGQGRWLVVVHFRVAPDEQALRALTQAAAGDEAAAALAFERVSARDWVAAGLAALKPVYAGRFVVHGAHDRAAIAPSLIAIEIEAALAFGTGHHGTTRGCLLALDRICKARRRVRARSGVPAHGPSGPAGILDLGTGTGVLAIAAARALRARVLAVDIDADAVRIARANAGRNGVGPLVATVHGNGIAGRHAPFNLIFANILLEPLRRLAPTLVSRLAPGGRLVLSGLLRFQANAARAAYPALGLERRIDLDEWTTLVLARRTGAQRGIAGARKDL